MKYQNIREEALKNKVANDYFKEYDCTEIIGNVDFSVNIKHRKGDLFAQKSLLWAEAKRDSSNIYNSIVQLILTIGKAKTYDKNLPPAMLGAFDGEKITFIPYNEIYEVFYISDFNWKVTPSNHETKEFKLIHEKVKNLIDTKTQLFYFTKDDKELKNFIKNNFLEGKEGVTKTRIDKNNFIFIYNKWLQSVKSTIAVNWEIAQKSGIIDGDFYLADLLSQENTTLKEKLFVVLKQDHYIVDRKFNEAGMFNSSKTEFNDKQVKHKQFWNIYERPPKEEYWDYIIERRDLLVPQDIRERKGSFFTPQIWVELSQKYLTEVLGKDWQDDYYIWDCAAGTGNLLNGLTNKYHIWASTLDKQDVDVMHDRIKNSANLLEDHVFQFDFLNDDFTKLPLSLQDIINNPSKRKKLVIYMNPPYAEISGKKIGVNLNRIHDKYADILEVANRELYAQFLIRIYYEIPECIIAEFSKLKAISGSNFKNFRNNFLAELLKCFIIPANSFDNVIGTFPIGFKIWNTSKKSRLIKFEVDIYEKSTKQIGKKMIFTYNNSQYFSKWVDSFKDKSGLIVGWLEGITRNDFQSQNGIVLLNKKEQIKVPRGIYITNLNILHTTISFAIRHCIKATWINDRDQFLYPNNKWKKDTEFHNDCLAYTLFHSQNKITIKQGTNHWIPFTEKEIHARDKFESNFMTQFMYGTLKTTNNETLPFKEEDLKSPKDIYNFDQPKPFVFSTEAKAVFNVGRELWIYYHQQPKCNINASLYDIKKHFQGTNTTGRMNNKSLDQTYTKLIGTLRENLKILADKIAPKVYEYGFLKE